MLERASDKHTLIINQSDLRLSKSPRIIKLHGSFPSGKPHIITKQDFKDYQKNYKAFINKVENDLLETMFCLIGFSGDDPNFIKWNEWLRGTLDKKYSAKIYFIGVGISEGEKNLLAGKNIQTIDIMCLAKPSDEKATSDPDNIIKQSLTTGDFKAAYTGFFDILF